MKPGLRWVALLVAWLCLASSQPVAAWYLELRGAGKKDGTEAGVWLSNPQALSRAEVYLLWYDADAAEGAQFASWQVTSGWGGGVVPITAEPLDVPQFEPLPLGGIGLPAPCPQGHRCFLGLIGVSPGSKPLDVRQWRRASVLPLTVEAAEDRLPGQTLFATAESQVLRGGAVYTLAGGARVAETGADGIATEKPDIFRREGTQILYANAQAEKFQVIEVADPAQPKLAGQSTLAGTPKEVYGLYGYYLVLQSREAISGSQSESRISVLHGDGSGQLQVVQNEPLPGSFLQSRRRGDVIYAVTQDWSSDGTRLHVLAHGFTPDGRLSLMAKAELPGYSPVVAIFSDYLVVANHDPQNWTRSQVQVFALSDSAVPLKALPMLRVPGPIPSEFHLDVQGSQLRLVHGPEDSRTGSTLAVYSLPDLALLGRVGDIAPGESLFATRFVNNLAFVVTYRRQDPLWVIDLSDPTRPAILGELRVPGWSEKLFFHDDRLFAVGIDDQPARGEVFSSVRRAAVSLFDVRDPTRPALLDRFTPLTREVAWSSSPAMEDERALLLDWRNAFAALPLESWMTQAGSHLQLVQFGQDRITDAGRLDLNTPLLRSLELDTNVLGVLGDQSFLTVRWGSGRPEVLAELELAANLTWLREHDGTLWAGGMGRSGYSHLYRYPLPLEEMPAQRWSLPRGYEDLVTDGKLALFYTRNPLGIQVIDLASGQVWPAEQLDAKPAEGSVSMWYQRSRALLHEGRLYLAERHELDLAYPSNTESLARPSLWVLRTWQLTPQGAVAESRYSIPGETVALTPDGRLLTREYTRDGLLRLNLLALDGAQARLLDSLSLECGGAETVWDGNQLSVGCSQDWAYGSLLNPNGDTDTAGSPARPRLLRVAVERTLRLVGIWDMPDHRQLLAAAGDLVMLRFGYYYYWTGIEPMPMVADVAIMPSVSSGCEIYRVSETMLELVKKLDICPWQSDGIALTPEEAYLARGFAGIEQIGW